MRMPYNGDTYSGDSSGDSGGGGTTDWRDNAASTTTFWDSYSNAFQTDYYNANGSYIGSHWDDYTFQNEPTSDAGYFLNFNVGDGVIVGGSLTYVPGSGFDLYVDAGAGDPGFTAGYTNSVSGFLSDWSATCNSGILWGAGDTFDPWGQNPDLQYGAMTLGSPGCSVTYGVDFEDFMYSIAGGIDNILLNY
jgi:hypothetical protein